MDKLKDRIARFFDVDSSEYLEHKYGRSGDSFMALRRERASAILSQYVTPSFHEEFHFLDCGCGPGILLDVLARHAINYCGLDLSEEMLKLARRQPAEGPSALRQKHLIRGDVESLPFPSGRFDAAASLGVIEYLEQDGDLLSEMARVVKPEGYLLIAVTNKYAYNLLFEGPLNRLRRNAAAVKVLNFVKKGLKLGAFRQAEFEKRRHSPREFTSALERCDLRIIDTVSWGFNFLPHPLQHLCGSRLNRWANAIYDRNRRRSSRPMGEGYLVLCQRSNRPLAGPAPSA